MTDENLLTLIRGNESYKALADTGADAELADAINAAIPAPEPVTIAALQQAAPQTLVAVAAGGDPLSELEVIASRVRDGDVPGIAAWAGTLTLLGKMPSDELTAVNALCAAAQTRDSVDHLQVSAVLNPIRPRREGDDSPLALPINWN